MQQQWTDASKAEQRSNEDAWEAAWDDVQRGFRSQHRIQPFDFTESVNNVRGDSITLMIDQPLYLVVVERRRQALDPTPEETVALATLLEAIRVLGLWQGALEERGLFDVSANASVRYLLPGRSFPEQIWAEGETLGLRPGEARPAPPPQPFGATPQRHNQLAPDAGSAAAMAAAPAGLPISGCRPASYGSRRGLVFTAGNSWFSMTEEQHAAAARGLSGAAAADPEATRWQLLAGGRRVAWGRDGEVWYATRDGDRGEA